LASIYQNEIPEGFIKPIVQGGYYDVFHIYNIRHSERDRLRKFMSENGVKTEIHYPLAPHRQKAMKEIIFGHYPIADEIHNTTLSLPISYANTEKEVLEVAKLLRRF